MAIDADDEILQDFLIEAGEILEQLGEQLVDLEQSPNDKDLLNAVFRGFHTIKGGAGFLNLDAMVTVCHRAEDVFNLLRNGERHVDPQLMDVVLRVLDVLNDQFEQIRSGNDPQPAEPVLIETLERYAVPASADEVQSEEPIAEEPVAELPVEDVVTEDVPTEEISVDEVATDELLPDEMPVEELVTDELPLEEVGFDQELPSEVEVSETSAPEAGDTLDPDFITDDEFDRLLDALQDPKIETSAAQPAPEQMQTEEQQEVSPGDDLHPEEFEALLDEMQGLEIPGDELPENPSVGSAEAEPGQSVDADLITDDEFENLLDELQGGIPATVAESAETGIEEVKAPAGDEITDEEFENLLDELQGEANKPEIAQTKVDTVSAPASDEITDDEFENLLDELQGKGSQPAPAQSAPAASNDLISDEEFENLLDELQGAGESSQPIAPLAQSAPETLDSELGVGEISDEEFSALLDKIPDDGGDGEAVSAASTSASESAPPEIPTLLEQTISNDVAPPPPAPAPKAASTKSSDEITDDEFENLLDELQGKAKSPMAATTAQETKSAAAAAKPAAAPAKPAAAPAKPAAAPAKPAAAPAKPAAAPAKPAAAPAKPAAAPAKPAAAPAKPAAAPAKPAAAPAKPAAAPAKPAAAPAKPASPPAASSAAKAAPATEDKGAGKDGAVQTETTVRVDTKRLDDIMNLVGELVLVRNRLSTLEASRSDEDMAKAVANLDVVTADLQSAVMKTRMQPIKKVFGRFPRVIRDLARNLKKEVNLELRGEETDLDKNLVEALADPLVHLVRNAVDHGIEAPDVRVARGKPRAGQVILSAEQEGDHILLTIADDGAGMDAEVLRKKAVEKGLMDTDAAARMDEKECFNLIFAAGFSTKTEISDVSGRGVGMDVVKSRIVQLNGTVEIQSALGKGSTIVIKVPLTLAIMPTLMVLVGHQIFALPLVNVSEIFHLDLTQTNVVDKQLCVMVRDRALPLYYLRRWLVKGASLDELPKEGHVVVVTVGNQQVGFVVDILIGQEEVVIKPLGAMLHGTDGLAGATITGDGRIALILDVPTLLRKYAGRR